MNDRQSNLIASALHAGDKAAFADLYDEYGSRVLAYLASRLRCQDQAKDVNQIVWLRVWRYRSSYDRTRSFTGWLFGIARNALNDAYHQAAARPNESPVDSEEIAFPACPNVDGDRYDHVVRVLMDQPAPIREAARRFWAEGQKLTEIADELQIPYKTLHSQLMRLKERTRSSYETT